MISTEQSEECQNNKRNKYVHLLLHTVINRWRIVNFLSNCRECQLILVSSQFSWTFLINNHMMNVFYRTIGRVSE